MLQEKNHKKACQKHENSKLLPKEQNHHKLGQKHRNNEILPQEQNHQKAGQSLRNMEGELDLPADAIVIHLPRSTANWGRDAPDKENQPWHNADRLLTSQGPVNTWQLCRQEGRRRSKKGQNKNKQGQIILTTSNTAWTQRSR